MATAQGKQGIWFILFPVRENTGNFVITQGKFLRHKENIFDCIHWCKKHVFLHIFSKFFSQANFNFQVLVYLLSYFLSISHLLQVSTKVRVATAQGKQGIWFLLFPVRENTGNFVVTQGKFLRHRENILTVFINAKNMFFFTYFKKFLIPNYCYVNYFYQ